MTSPTSSPSCPLSWIIPRIKRGKDQIGKRKAENEFELWSEEINIYTFGVNYLLKNAW